MAIALVSLTLKGFGVGVGGSEGMVVLLPLHATRKPVSTRTNKLQMMPRIFKERFLSYSQIPGTQSMGITSTTIYLLSISLLTFLRIPPYLRNEMSTICQKIFRKLRNIPR